MYIDAVDEHFSFCRLLDPVQDIEQGGLPGATGTHDAYHITGFLEKVQLMKAMAATFEYVFDGFHLEHELIRLVTVEKTAYNVAVIDRDDLGAAYGAAMGEQVYLVFPDQQAIQVQLRVSVVLPDVYIGLRDL